jgi:hypothetical protein
MELFEIVKNVKTKNEFLRFLEILIKDFIEHQEDWENVNLKDFLEAMHSWISDTEEDDMAVFEDRKNKESPKKMNWNILANILCASKIYE